MRYADLVFMNGRVFTADASNSVAQAVAVAGNRIAAVGSEAAVAEWRGPRTEVVDLNGRSLLPGFIDAHAHLGIFGITRSSVPCGLPQVHSIEELKGAIRQRAEGTPKGEWVRGWGYNQNDLAEQRHPNRWDLDEAAPDHPVFVSRTCAHIAVLNSRALELIGIDESTPDPRGGIIARDEHGTITGVLIEEARRIAWERAAPTVAELVQALGLAADALSRLGITTTHDMAGYGPNQLKALIELSRREPFKLRVVQTIRAMFGNDRFQPLFLQSGLVGGFGNDRVSLGPWKTVVDGASSAPSMATREPYAVDPNNSGILYVNQEELNEAYAAANRCGYQVTAHAVGDRAVEMCVNAIEFALRDYPRQDARHRIEHCALVDEALVSRIKALGIVPVLQPIFLWPFGDGYLRDYGPERGGRMFPTALYRKHGVRFALSSDAPITDCNPLLGIEIAATRRTKGGQVAGPEERLDVASALRGYTIDAAYVSFDEGNRGSLEAGKLADLVVLSGDLLSTPVEEIRGMSVDLTVVDGKVVHAR